MKPLAYVLIAIACAWNTLSARAQSCSSVAAVPAQTSEISGTLRVYAYGVSGASTVYFPTWGNPGGQDDLVWYVGTNAGGGTWYADVQLANHKVGNPEFGTFYTHVYMNGNVFCGGLEWTRSLAAASCSSAAPQSGSTSQTSGPFRVYAYGVQNATGVLFPTWGEPGGQDDLVWYQGTNAGNGTWYADIDMGNHKAGNPEYGTFIVHVYANGATGLVGCPNTSFVRIATPPPSCSGVAPQASVTRSAEGTFRVWAFGVSNATSLTFPTWGDAGGQDDIVWYPGVNAGNGTWYADVNLGAHKAGSPELGLFHSHVYMSGPGGYVGCAASTFTRLSAFETIKDPVCISDPVTAAQSFSTGEQYNDPNNGILLDRWFMLSRWQGENEQDFVNNIVSYDFGKFTGLYGAFQRGVAPERSDGSAGVQLSCYDIGMWINTWTVPYRPINGGGYNDMFGYAFSSPNQVRPFIKDGVPTELVLQGNVGVPWFDRWNRPGSSGAIHGQVTFFAYLRDTAHPSYAPIVVIAATHGSNLAEEPYLTHGLVGWDYSAADTDTFQDGPHGYWFTSSPPGSSGVWFASAPINSANNQRYVTTRYTQGQLTQDLAIVKVENPNPPMPFWRAHISPQNLINIVTDINGHTCSPACPPRPPGGYSSLPGDWVLEYAGVIAEARVVPADLFSDNWDASRFNWGGDYFGPTPYSDQTRDHVVLGVRINAPGIYRYYP
jgi:hypothetical protein